MLLLPPHKLGFLALICQEDLQEVTLTQDLQVPLRNLPCPFQVAQVPLQVRLQEAFTHPLWAALRQLEVAAPQA